MRMILFFDLPVVTDTDRRNYRKFIKQLKSEGFLQLQESVYTKLVLNHSSVGLQLNRVKSFAPPSGLIQVLTVTEKQFSGMVDIVGSPAGHSEISSTDRLVIL